MNIVESIEALIDRKNAEQARADAQTARANGLQAELDPILALQPRIDAALADDTAPTLPGDAQ